MKSIAFLILGALGACAAAPDLPRERVALELPPGLDPWWFTASPGGGGAAYAERHGADAYLIFRGARYGPYP